MPRVHLVSTRRRGFMTACGQRHVPVRVSSDPADVTCRACQKTVAMAEAELRQQQKRRP